MHTNTVKSLNFWPWVYLKTFTFKQIFLVCKLLHAPHFEMGGRTPFCWNNFLTTNLAGWWIFVYWMEDSNLIPDLWPTKSMLRTSPMRGDLSSSLFTPVFHESSFPVTGVAELYSVCQLAHFLLRLLCHLNCNYYFFGLRMMN